MEVLGSSRQRQGISSKSSGCAASTTHKIVYEQSLVLEKQTMSAISRVSENSGSLLKSLYEGGVTFPAATTVPQETAKEIERGSTLGKKKPAKKAAKPRRKWKKPKDKPKRPLSAYNIYFKDERERIVSGLVPDCSRSLGFRAMAQFVAKKWNTLNSEERSEYEERATAEKTKYFIALAQWKKKKKREEEQEAAKECKATAKVSGVKRGSSQTPGSPPNKKATKKSRPVSKTSGTNQLSDINEPLPIEYNVDMTNDLGSILSGASSLGDKHNDSLIDTLQETLGCPSHKHHHAGMVLNQGCTLTPYSVPPVMKRMLATFDALHADNEFVDFMTTLDWK